MSAQYRQLPELGDLGVRHSRGLLPVTEGTLSLIDPGSVVAAAGLVREGLTVPLNLAVDAFDPPLFGRERLRHRVVTATRNEAEDVLDDFNPQSSSQLDGLAHVRAREHGYYDGSVDLYDARVALGMHHWAVRGIAGRAVLLDATHLAPDPFAGRGVTAAELRALADRLGVELRRGDIVLLRTGWAPALLALAAADRTDVTGWTGLDASDDMAEFLWDAGIAAVGADNPAVENGPGSAAIGSLHRRLLPALGMPLFELLDLERLAVECERLGRWEFLFVSVPLHVHGAVSSPANAMALI